MAEELTRAPMREAVREEMRPPVSLDPRAEADRRTKEILESLEGVNLDSSDEFWAPPPPAGWTYEWKRRTVYNQEDPAYTLDQKLHGWSEVPCGRHPEMMPPGNYATIERKGMVLMERPTQIVEMFRKKEINKAREQIQAKEAQLHATPDGTMQRTLADVRKSFAPVVIPDK